MRTAGDRTRRRRLNKLSCADWLPHDRGFVSGLPRSKWRASVWGPAHNRAGGFPTAALSPAMRTIGGLARVVLSFLFKSVVSVVWPCGVVGDALASSKRSGKSTGLCGRCQHLGASAWAR